jgi:sulfur relay protein TusB/DsrH
MSKYLLIESRDPFESPDVGQVLEMAKNLTSQGDEVTLYLVQNAVLATRSGAKTSGLAALASEGKVKVLVDDYSLDERGIEKEELTGGASVSNMDTLVDLLMTDGQRAIWC